MVAWKMSTVIVAGKGYQGLLPKPPFGYAKQLNSPNPRSNKHCLWIPLQLRTAAGRKMVAWKMSTVIVAGKGINRARSTNHDRTEITNSNQPYFWGGVFSTHEIWEEKIWERLFWSTLIFIRVEKFLAGWTNKGNKVTISTLLRKIDVDQLWSDNRDSIHIHQVLA